MTQGMPGLTPMLAAILSNDFEMMKTLAHAGANLLRCNRPGESAWVAAKAWSRAECASWLEGFHNAKREARAIEGLAPGAAGEGAPKAAAPARRRI